MTLCEVIEQRKSLWDVIIHLKLMRWTEELESKTMPSRSELKQMADDCKDEVFQHLRDNPCEDS